MDPIRQALQDALVLDPPVTPLLDLGALNEPMMGDIIAATSRVISSGRYVLGPEVEGFETEWAEYCGTRYCVGTANALEALEIILRAYGIGPGDEVIVPANTYIATWLAVTHVGATIVPVDCHYETRNIDPTLVDAAITSRTKAIIAVHLYGLCADMVALGEIASAHGLLLIEDAAQAHGASAGRTHAGALGHAAAFSFYPSKNLGALGDGGAITTNDHEIAAKARRLRNYGGVGRLDHQVIGINSRLDEMQAAILRAKLPYLYLMNKGRTDRARRYCEVLESDPLQIGLPIKPFAYKHIYHQFVVEVERRHDVIAKLRRSGVDAHIHYPVPPYLEPAYAHMARYKGAFPATEALARTVLSLPIGNDGIQVERIAHTLLEAVQ